MSLRSAVLLFADAGDFNRIFIEFRIKCSRNCQLLQESPGEYSSHTKQRYVYAFPQRKRVWGLSVKHLALTLNIYCSYWASMTLRYSFFRQLFLTICLFHTFFQIQLKIYMLAEKMLNCLVWNCMWPDSRDRD